MIPALSWPPSPVPGVLAANEVHIWGWALRPDATDPSAHVAILDNQDLQRMDCFHFARDRTNFAVNHANLRRILGAYLRHPPQQVRFVANRFGKPEIAGATPLAFNLSHSHSVAVLAVADEQPVGIDVEDVQPIEPEVATRHFSLAEQAALNQLRGDAWLAGFYRCWTRKEALLKAEGVGLHRALDSFDVSLLPGQPAELLATRENFLYPWKLHHLTPVEGAMGALATAQPQARVSCFSFVPQ